MPKLDASWKAALGAWLACAATGALAAPLTLGDAQRLAVESSPQLRAYAASIRSARDMGAAAARLPDPVLKLNVENVPVEGPERFTIGRDFMTMRRIGLMQEATAGDKLRFRGQRFESEARKAEAEKDAAIAAVQRDAAIAWLDRYYAEAQVQLIAEQRTEAQREVEGAEAAYRAGRGSQAEVFAARAALVSLEDRSSEMRRKVATAKTALARWIGEAGREPLAGAPDITDIPDELETEHLELAHHPQVLVAARQEEMATAEANLARANRDPDWTWEVAYSRRGSPFPDMFSIGVSVPLPWDRANKQDRELSARLAQVEQSRALLEETVRAHTAEVRAMREEWLNGLERRRRYDIELTPLARQRTESSLAAYRGGRASLADVLAARRGELEVRMQKLQLELEVARLWAQLSFLTPNASGPKGTP